MAEKPSKTQIVIWSGAIIVFIILVGLFWKADGAQANLNLITVILTAVTVILGSLAIIIGVLAYISHREIKEAAERAAGIVAKETAESTAQKVAQDTAREWIRNNMPNYGIDSNAAEENDR